MYSTAEAKDFCEQLKHVKHLLLVVYPVYIAKILQQKNNF